MIAARFHGTTAERVLRLIAGGLQTRRQVTDALPRVSMAEVSHQVRRLIAAHLVVEADHLSAPALGKAVIAAWDAGDPDSTIEVSDRDAAVLSSLPATGMRVTEIVGLQQSASRTLGRLQAKGLVERGDLVPNGGRVGGPAREWRRTALGDRLVAARGAA